MDVNAPRIIISLADQLSLPVQQTTAPRGNSWSSPMTPAKKNKPGEANNRPASPVTLYDVAARARVSAMTVSRVVNGKVNVSERTREKVMRAIEELGYHVNVAARAARIGTLRVGLLYSNPSAAFLSALLIGAMGQCSASGAELVVEHGDDLSSKQKTIDRLIAHHADGVMVLPPLCDTRAPWCRSASRAVVHGDRVPRIGSHAIAGARSLATFVQPGPDPCIE